MLGVGKISEVRPVGLCASHLHRTFRREDVELADKQSTPQNHDIMHEHAPPTTASIAIACALVAGVTGYFLGQAKSIGIFGGSAIAPGPGKRLDESDVEESGDEEDEGEEGDLASEFPGHNEECKLVLVVRTDLGMTKGTSNSFISILPSTMFSVSTHSSI